MTISTPQLLWIVALLAVALSLPAMAETMPDSVAYSVQWVHRMRVHVITVDLYDRSLMVVPMLAYDTPGRRRSFIGFMADYQPLAQITGSYFSLKSALPIGDIVISGEIRYRGPVGSALALTATNEAQIVNIPYGWTYSWPGYENVLQGGLRLVQNGKYAVYPHDQGFRDPGLFRHATRTAVGLTPAHKLLLVAINKEILLSELAAIMKGLGCRDAMTLDGGTSTGLAYGDDVILTPGRTLSNVLMVMHRPDAAPAPSSASTAPPLRARNTAPLSLLTPHAHRSLPIPGNFVTVTSRCRIDFCTHRKQGHDATENVSYRNLGLSDERGGCRRGGAPFGNPRAGGSARSRRGGPGAAGNLLRARKARA